MSTKYLVGYDDDSYISPYATSRIYQQQGIPTPNNPDPKIISSSVPMNFVYEQKRTAVMPSSRRYASLRTYGSKY